MAFEINSAIAGSRTAGGDAYNKPPVEVAVEGVVFVSDRNDIRSFWECGEICVVVEKRRLYWRQKGEWYMKKNVLLFSHQLKVGGAPAVLCEMGKILCKMYNVVVLSPADGVMRHEFEQNGMEVIISGEITDDLRQIIVQEFDFAVANTTLALPFVIKLMDQMQIYWWIHESSLVYDGRQGMKEYYQFAAEYAKIFAAGHVAAANFYHFYGIKTQILEFGLEDSYIPQHECKKHDEINIICPSTICELKGQDLLVQAIVKMKPELRGKCRFIFLGELRTDNAREYEMVKKLNDEYENVELYPLQERKKLLELYYDVDVVVAPSREDATPATIVEGLMYHKICLCSSGTGVSRYLKDGWNGYVFENRNEDDLKNKLEYIVCNYKEQEQVRERGREVYDSIYSYDIFERNVLNRIGK